MKLGGRRYLGIGTSGRLLSEVTQEAKNLSFVTGGKYLLKDIYTLV